MFFHWFVELLRNIFFFFFNDTATTEIYTLSLHDALPILLPNSGTLPSASRASSTGPWSTEGSPGPFDSTRPSGCSARTSDHVAVCGSTTTVQPRSRSERRMLDFTP